MTLPMASSVAGEPTQECRSGGSILDQATPLWTWWLSLLRPFAVVFTRPGWGRFVQGVTGMRLCWEDHTLTQRLTASGLASRWRVLEPFAEYGAGAREAVERHTRRLIEPERPARWGAYHPVALADTKGHRPSKSVWGACTVHESRARSPNRAETVRAHHWGVMGDLGPGRPWTHLPHAVRLSCRRTQLPEGATFRTKTRLAVEVPRQADAESAVPVLAVFDGAYAVDTVVHPCLEPPQGRRRLALITRLRVDARLYHPVGAQPRAKGRPRKWGSRSAAPRHHLDWPVGWQRSRAWVYGRLRQCHDKQLRCCWAVSGPHIPGHAVVVQMTGDAAPWFLVTTAPDLSAAPVVAVWAARFRQADGVGDHKQRLGMEECRAWTKEPILRTVPVQLVALTLVRRLQAHRDQVWGAGTWWFKPPWNARKRQASILDRRRLCWRSRLALTHVLVALEALENIPQTPGQCRRVAGRAA